MDPIKPIEGILDDVQGQGLALAEAARDRYWQQQAQEVPAVEVSEEPPEVKERRQSQPEEKQVQPRSVHNTYAEFEVNRDTREVTVRIIDAENGKLVRTIPPENLAKELARGNFHPDQLRRRAVLV